MPSDNASAATDPATSEHAETYTLAQVEAMPEPARSKLLAQITPAATSERDHAPGGKGRPSDGYDREALALTYDDAHEAARSMGYPSITEALEHLSELRTPAPVLPVEEIARLLERLRDEVFSGGYRPGGGTISADGTATSYGGEKTMVPRNPDGLAAARLIDALLTAAEARAAPQPQADVERINEDHPLLAAILKVRRTAACDFSPERRRGNEMQAYDAAVLDCYRAVEAALSTPDTKDERA